jgi:hypothetical protein
LHANHGVCSFQWSLDNLALTAGVGLELAHGDGMSCGLDVALGWTVGSLPGRNEGLGSDRAGQRTMIINLIYNYDHYLPIRR